MRVKVYLVMQADESGEPTGEVVAAKLTRGIAQSIAKENAPCMVIPLMADKTPHANGPTSRGGSDGTSWSEHG